MRATAARRTGAGRLTARHAERSEAADDPSTVSRMTSFRIEVVDDATGVYVALDPDGLWSATDELDELVAVDKDGQGRIIGIEASGPAAVGAVEGLVRGLIEGAVDEAAVRQALSSTPLANNVSPQNRQGGAQRAKRPRHRTTKNRKAQPA